MIKAKPIPHSCAAAIPARWSGWRSLLNECPWQDLHLHYAEFESAVSAVGLHGHRNGASGRTCTCGLPIRNQPLFLLSYGDMKWCPWQDSHPHWTASEAVVSALDYMGKNWQPRVDLHHQLSASKANALLIELQGCLEWVGPAGIAPASSGL